MKKFLLLLALLPSLAFGHGAPVIWNGTSAKWLPSGLQSAGVCKLSAAGVMSSSTVSDSELASSYLYADGTRGLSGNWNAGQNITAPAFIGALTGNADTATALANNPSDCGAGTKATSIDASGNLTCSAVSLTADVSGTLPVANGGTGTGTAFTQGSVVFAGASGVYSQDNSSLFWDDTNNRLGIGTNSPSYRLHFQAGADDYAHGVAFSHALGGANSLWRLYPDLNSKLGIYNPAQGTTAFSISGTGQQLQLNDGGEDGGAVNIRNATGRTTHHTLVLKKLASQTGDAIRIFDADGATTIAKWTIAGAIEATGLTISGFTAGVAKFNGSGVISSGSVALGSDVSGTLPVANGGTGLTGGTSGGIPYYSGASTLASSGALSQYQVVLGGGAGGAPNVVSGTGTSGQVLTSNGAGANPTWQDAASGSTLTVSVKTADYTLTNSDDVILVNGSSPITITLHAVSGATSKAYRIKNVGIAPVTIAAAGSDVFDRTSEKSIELPPGGVPTSGAELIPDTGGSSWSIF